MNRELYEKTYKRAEHFSFGENWREFLRSLTPVQIETAKTSLTDFLGLRSLKGKRFLDLGCGSGLFSLAAYRLKAREIVSVDTDDGSLLAARSLKEKAGSPSNWRILKGSALGRGLPMRLGTFDIVYSWGVLHHTGDMFGAIENSCALVKRGGLLYIAIYNENKTNLIHGTSAFWLRVKRIYNRSGKLTKRLLYYSYATYLWVGLLLSGKNPSQYIKNYRINRGMSWKHDIIDWLGGYPYEFAPPGKIINFLKERNFVCTKVVKSNAIGNNEYLFIREK
jgi:2-polyprenyl-3-methyl-5-hydroxy-6-metoxy-1,4-benzoquinol methylase